MARQTLGTVVIAPTRAGDSANFRGMVVGDPTVKGILRDLKHDGDYRLARRFLRRVFGRILSRFLRGILRRIFGRILRGILRGVRRGVPRGPLSREFRRLLRRGLIRRVTGGIFRGIWSGMACRELGRKGSWLLRRVSRWLVRGAPCDRVARGVGEARLPRWAGVRLPRGTRHRAGFVGVVHVLPAEE